MTVLAHPLTGEIIPDSLEELDRAEQAVDAALRAVAPLYEFRRSLRVRIAELRGPAELPKPRLRSLTQSKVASCPRCGGEL